MNPSVPWYFNPLFLTPVFGFIGVIIGALVSGFGGWFIAEANRSHEFERERRRRKQDCLEAVMEKLDDAESAISAFSTKSLTYRIAKYNPPPEIAVDQREKLVISCLKDTTESSGNVDTALQNLQHYRTKLVVFGFTDCAQSLNKYHSAALSFRVLMNEFRDNKKTPDEYASARKNLGTATDSLREMLTRAFAAL